MGALVFDTLLRSVKKAAPAPTYYLYGDEDILKDEAVRAISAAALDPASRDFNLDSRVAAELEVESLHTLLNTLPMLAERRVVVLHNIEGLRRKPKVREELMRYMERPAASTVLVLVQGGGEEGAPELSRHAISVEISRLPPERVARWLAHRAGELGLTLEPEAAAHLQRVTGDDLGVLARELEKLAGIDGGHPISRDEVAQLVGVRHGETVEDLVGAVLERDTLRAAPLVEPVLGQPGVTGVRIVTALGTELLGTALARAELDQGISRNRLGGVLFNHLGRLRPRLGRPWKQAVAQWTRWAERWTSLDSSAALRRTLEADGALKRGTVTNERGLVLELVLALGVRAREAA